MNTSRTFLVTIFLAIVGILAAWHEFNTKRMNDLGMIFYKAQNQDFFAPLNTRSLNIEAAAEQDSGKDFRWAYGPATVLTFYTRSPHAMKLCFSIRNIIEGQHMIVEVNGNILARINSMSCGSPEDFPCSQCLNFQARAGENTLRFVFGKWNHHPDAFAPLDSRPMAVRFTRLRIEENISSESGS